MPTAFHDPSRQRLANGLPCWLGAQLVLPDVVVEVAEESQRFVARVMVPTGANRAAWRHTGPLGLTDLARLLIDWHDGPEEALVKWWHEQPPDSARWSEERQGGQRVETVLVPAGTVDVDELGL